MITYQIPHGPGPHYAILFRQHESTPYADGMLIDSAEPHMWIPVNLMSSHTSDMVCAHCGTLHRSRNTAIISSSLVIQPCEQMDCMVLTSDYRNVSHISGGAILVQHVKKSTAYYYPPVKQWNMMRRYVRSDQRFQKVFTMGDSADLGNNVWTDQATMMFDERKYNPGNIRNLMEAQRIAEGRLGSGSISAEADFYQGPASWSTKTSGKIMGQQATKITFDEI